MIISMGGASLLFGLRETTNDIDILMIDTLDRQIFNRLVSEGHQVKRYEQTGIMIGADIIAVGEIDLHWYVEMRLLNNHYSELPEYLKDRYNQLVKHK